MNLLEEFFPKLSSGNYRVTSPPDNRYNCIALAAGDTSQWWWPLSDARYYWPPTISREATIDAFVSVFRSFGYELCDGAEVKGGYEYVALFADAANVPTHAARQLPGGKWTSKLGEAEHIEHELRDLEGDAYGTVVAVLRR